MKEWSDELSRLSEIDLTQPHAAYPALTHGLLGRWSFLSKMLPDIDEWFSALEQTIHIYLLPVLFSKFNFSDAKRKMILLPSHLGELGIIYPVYPQSFSSMPHRE